VRVVLFRDFVEDQRTSMEVYADHLRDALRQALKPEWRLDDYQPRLARFVKTLPLSDFYYLRFARFCIYPWHARRSNGDLNHIIDHGYGHLTLTLGFPTVVTVHDLIPMLRWKGAITGVTPDRRHPLSDFSFRMLGRAAHLITVSENTKRDLTSHIECDAERITVIYPGVSSSFRPCTREEKASFRAKLGLPGIGSRLVLAFGNSFYKNAETSLAVIRRLQDKFSRLFMIHLGYSSVAWRASVRDAGMTERVIELNEVKSMWELYNAVDCLLFPSWYEGFGMPPVEAMACGIPVVTSNVASLPEVVDEEGLMANPDDVNSLSAAVHLMLGNDLRREEQIRMGLRHARKFTWEQTAAKTIKVYEQLHSGGIAS
jgi:glycosyltransferase involved in cell wall biosynthesis